MVGVHHCHNTIEPDGRYNMGFPPRLQHPIPTLQFNRDIPNDGLRRIRST